MAYKKQNDEVYYTVDSKQGLDCDSVEFIRKKALQNKRKRARICTHNSLNDDIHEMIIAIAKETYVKPHKHENKCESFHMIEGSLLVVLFNEHGLIEKQILMGDFLSGNIFYYRIESGTFHTVIPYTDTVIFHETTKGPFNPADTVYASWAPDESSIEINAAYINKLKLY